MVWMDQVLPALDGEDGVDIDLGVGVGHAPTMPLLTELENGFFLGFPVSADLRRRLHFSDTPLGFAQKQLRIIKAEF